MKRTQQQRSRILAILLGYQQGLTRNEINSRTRATGREIPIQTLCRRMRELEELGLVATTHRRECTITRATSCVYQLTAAGFDRAVARVAA